MAIEILHSEIYNQFLGPNCLKRTVVYFQRYLFHQQDNGLFEYPLTATRVFMDIEMNQFMDIEMNQF